MAKYTRYDARNKKNAKHKRQSLNKDIRIRRVNEEKSSKINMKRFTSMYDEEELFSENHE